MVIGGNGEYGRTSKDILSMLSWHLCAATGCRSTGTNECFSCGRHYCDRHMLLTRLEGTDIGDITVEACSSCMDRAVSLYTKNGARVASWRRKEAT